MRLAPAVLALTLAVSGSIAADPIYIDQLMETPLDALQTHFAGLKRDGCYTLPDGRFVLVNVNRGEQKAWRIAITADAPCRRPAAVRTPMDLQQRKGVAIGDSAADVVAKLGRPDAATDTDSKLRKFGDSEYFYVCRVDQECARHTSIFMRDGLVSAIAEWYSE